MIINRLRDEIEVRNARFFTNFPNNLEPTPKSRYEGNCPYLAALKATIFAKKDLSEWTQPCICEPKRLDVLLQNITLKV